MFAVIYISNFPLQAALRQMPDCRLEPVALVDPGDSKPLIIQTTVTAKLAGVHPGMTPSQALARCPSLKLIPRQTSHEEAGTEILLQTAYAFSPNIEATRLGVCTVELKGLGLAHPAAAQDWGTKVIDALESLQFDATMGIGPTPDLALLAAQGLPLSVPEKNQPNAAATAAAASLPPSKTLDQLEFSEVACLPRKAVKKDSRILFASDDFVAALPIAAVTPSLALAEILARWGVRTIGEYLALGKAEIADRLGPEALAVFARVSPTAIRPLKLVTPPEQYSEAIEFEAGVETAEPLLAWLRRFSDQLARRLGAIYLVVAQLRLHLGLASGAKYERLFKIPSPTGDSRVLFRMLQTHLETLRTDSPIMSLQLAATPARPEMHQFGLFQNTLRNPNQFAETLTRLGAIVGADNLGTPVLESSHRPDALRLQPPNFEFVPAQAPAAAEPVDGLQLRRFRPPLPAQVDFRGEEPVRLSSPGFHGPIAEWRGPYLSSGNWWDANRWAREEWDVALAGGALLRLFRSSDGCFVEGAYD